MKRLSIRVRVVEEPILLRVEDLQPDLVPLPERQGWWSPRPRRGCPCWRRRSDHVLALCTRPMRQMLVGRRDVVGEVVDARHAADELATGSVVVSRPRSLVSCRI